MDGLFDPDADALFDALAPLIDDGMLRQIAAADYGQDVELHLEPLKRFRDARAIPVLNHHPSEVLELIRWSEPEHPDWLPGDTGRRGHLLRAFACATLLRSHAMPESRARWFGLNETAIQLIESLKALGGTMKPPGTRFFAWCVQTLAPLGEEEEGFEGLLLGTGLLSLVVEDPRFADDDIVALCKWIDARASALPEASWGREARSNWLWSPYRHGQRNDKWAALGRSLYLRAEALGASDKTTWVALIGRSLAGD